MSFIVAEVSEFERRVTFRLAEGPLAQAESRAARQLGRDVQVDGFRRGRAPRRMVERIIGRSRIRTQAIENMLGSMLGEVWQESGLRPAIPPTVQDIREGQDGVEVDVMVVLRPTVSRLPEYKGRQIRCEVLDPITEDDVSERVEQFLEQFAELHPQDRPARVGDVLALDVTASASGAPLESLAATGAYFDLGSESVVEGLTEQLVGHEAGETVEFTAPLRAAVEDLSEGHEIDLKVEIGDVYERQLPDLDDEWVEENTPYASAAALRERVRDELERLRNNEMAHRFESALIAELSAEVDLDIPEAFLEAMATPALKNVLDRASEDEDRLAALWEGEEGERGVDALYRSLKDQAQKEFRVQALLEAVMVNEGLTVDDNEIRAWHAARTAVNPDADGSRLTLDDALEDGELRSRLRADILRWKSIEALMTDAVAVDDQGAVIDLSLDSGEPEVVKAEVE